MNYILSTFKLTLDPKFSCQEDQAIFFLQSPKPSMLFGL